VAKNNRPQVGPRILPPSTLAPEALPARQPIDALHQSSFQTPTSMTRTYGPHNTSSHPPSSSQYGPASSKTRPPKSWAASFSAETRRYTICPLAVYRKLNVGKEAAPRYQERTTTATTSQEHTTTRDTTTPKPRTYCTERTSAFLSSQHSFWQTKKSSRTKRTTNFHAYHTPSKATTNIRRKFCCSNRRRCRE
jgi:hypothetical protein